MPPPPPERLPPRPAGAPYDLASVLDWSADGSTLLALDADGAVCALDVDDWRLLARFGRGYAARLRPDGRAVAFADGDRVHVLDGSEAWSRRSIDANARALAWSHDGLALAVGTSRRIDVHDLARPAFDRPARSVAHRSGMDLQVALGRDRLVVYSVSAPPEMAAACVTWEPGAPTGRPLDLPEGSAPLEQPRRALLLPGGLLLRAGTRPAPGGGARPELDVIAVPEGRLVRSVELPSDGYADLLAATPDGRLVVAAVGEANGPQHLVAIEAPAESTSDPSSIADLDAQPTILCVSPDGRTVLYRASHRLWRLRLAPARPPDETATAARLAATFPAPVVPGWVRLARAPAEVIGAPPPMAGRHQEHTRALFVAGRAVHSRLPTWGHLAAIRDLATRRGDGLVVVVAGDEVEWQPGAHAPDATISARVVIGYPIAEAHADAGPRGPVPLDALEAGVARIATVDDAFWRAVAAVFAATNRAPSATAYRAAFRDGPLAEEHADVALDADEVLATRARVHLVPTGPRAYVTVVLGVPGPVPPPDADPAERLHWHHGQDSRQEPHAVGVRGERVAVADTQGMGTRALDLDDLAARLRAAPAAAGLYVVASYH